MLPAGPQPPTTFTMIFMGKRPFNHVIQSRAFGNFALPTYFQFEYNQTTMIESKSRLQAKKISRVD